MKFVTVVLVLLAFLCPVAQGDVGASRVRPVARKLEEHTADFAETPQEAKELKALLPLKYSVVEDEEINAAAQGTRNTIIVKLSQDEQTRMILLAPSICEKSGLLFLAAHTELSLCALRLRFCA